MEPTGYYPIKESNGLWTHKLRNTIFALCVDDFGIKYFSKDNADHLIKTLKPHYDITINHDGQNYCRLTLDWNYAEGYVDVSMPGYIVRALQNFNTENQQGFSTHHISGTNPLMVNESNTPKPKIPNHFTKKAYALSSPS